MKVAASEVKRGDILTLGGDPRDAPPPLVSKEETRDA